MGPQCSDEATHVHAVLNDATGGQNDGQPRQFGLTQELKVL
jgi:hypothetical protein